jgi:hypothetical protein
MRTQLESQSRRSFLTMNPAYATRDRKRARRLRENLGRRLESDHPSAAASLREGPGGNPSVMRPDPPEKPGAGAIVDQLDGETLQPGLDTARRG